VRVRSRGLAPAAIALLLAGCGGPALLDPTEGEVAIARQAVVDVVLLGAEDAAEYFHADESLGARIDTTCSAGTDNWKIHDSFRSECDLQVRTAFPLDAEPWTALPGLAQHMRAHDWGGAHWNVDPVGGAGFETLEELQAAGLALSDVTGISFVYYGDTGGVADSVRLGMRFEPAGSPAPIADPPAGPEHGEAEPTGHRVNGNYFASTDGSDWEDAWAEERAKYSYVLVAGSHCEFARQPW
jgi:hypothetical protein